MKPINKIKIVCFLLLYMLSCGVLHGYAAGFYDVQIENDILNGTVHISGGIDSLYEISFCVTDTNVSSLSYTEAVLEEKTYAIGQTQTLRSGTGMMFAHTLKMPAGLATGTYRIFIYADDRDGFYRDFSYSRQATALSGFTLLNTKTDTEDILKGIDAYMADLKFDDYYYNGFSAAQKEQLAELFVSNRPAGGYPALADMQASFNAVSFIVRVGNEASIDTIDDCIVQRGGLYGDVATYLSCEKAARFAVCEKLKGNFSVPAEFFGFIEDESVVQSFRCAQVWNEYPDLLTYFNKYFSLTQGQQSKLAAISDVNEIYKSMYLAKDGYHTIRDIFSKYTSLIESVYNAQNAQKPGGGGSAPGGGGSVNITVGAPNGNTPAGNDPSGTTNPPQTDEIFYDIDNALWAKESILDLYERKIVSGSTNGYFYPNNLIKREEFAKMAALAFQLKSEAALPFDDVPEDAWYRSYLSLAYGENIIFGIDTNLFGVGQNLTRQDLAVIIYRAMRLKNVEFGEERLNFSDNGEIASYAREAVGKICGLGIISGMPDGTFRPGEYATRAQTAVILSGVLAAMKQ